MIERPKVIQPSGVTSEEFYQHANAINRLSEEDYVSTVLNETLNAGSGVSISLNNNIVTISSSGGGGDSGSDGVIGGGRRYGEDGYILGGRRYS